jgi:hypothetical protein
MNGHYMKFGGYRSGMKCKDDDELLIGKTWEVQGIDYLEILSRNSLEDCENIHVHPE